MKFAYSLALIAVALFLTACASAPSGDQFSGVGAAKEDKALVYIYRPDVYYGKATTYPVLLDENKIADIANRGFFSIELDPGTYSIRPDTPSIDHDLSVEVEAGEITYLRLTTNEKPAFCFCTSLQFEVVEELIAVNQMADTREEIERVYFK